MQVRFRSSHMRTLVARFGQLGCRQPRQRAPLSLMQPHQHGHARLITERDKLAKGSFMDRCRRAKQEGTGKE